MSYEKKAEVLEFERLKKQNEQIDVEIAYRKVELELLREALAEKRHKNQAKARP